MEIKINNMSKIFYLKNLLWYYFCKIWAGLITTDYYRVKWNVSYNNSVIAYISHISFRFDIFIFRF